MLRSATAQIEPPLPPSPPSGPPNGRNFSRQNEAQPLPPSPAMTSIFASSINFMMTAKKLKRLYRWQSLSMEGLRLAMSAPRTARACLRCYCLGSDDGDELLRTDALLDKLHGTVDQREQGVILAGADVGACAHGGAALTDDDAAGSD